MGHDLNDPLWSAKTLLDSPEDVEAVHARYLEAGADCIVTATYQATHEGLARRGLTDRDAERTMLDAVRLALRARSRFLSGPRARGRRRRPLVAASVGPYGAFLADGSEYTGAYGLEERELCDFHRRRWRVLAESPADLTLAESLPCLVEARALLSLAKEGHGEKPVWFSFTCRDGAHLSDGTPVAAVADWARTESLVAAVGVNCTRRQWVPSLVRALVDRARTPVVAYPNAGGAYDPVAKRWSECERDADWGEECLRWIDAGAAAVGGCCRVGPADVRRMRRALDRGARPGLRRLDGLGFA